MAHVSRRTFLQSTALAAGALALPRTAFAQTKMRFGLCTYLWGKDWDVPTLIANCEKTGVLGVELRTEHAHGVDPGISKEVIEDVRKRFEDSPVELVGLGSNADFDSPSRRTLERKIEDAKAFMTLSHQVGGSGVKVKPNRLHDRVPHEETIEQIGNALNELGAFGADIGQEVRLEVHGNQTSDLPVVAKIMEVADHPNVGVCWNCNSQDLDGEGLEHNFNLVQDRFGATAHVRELNVGEYPYQELVSLFVGMDYDGWVLLEARTNPGDLVAGLQEQRELFEAMVAKANA